MTSTMVMNLVLLSGEDDVGRDTEQCCQLSDLRLGRLRWQAAQMKHTTWLGRLF